MNLEQAYAECNLIAKREAKNFYYSFLALSAPRRNAMCAVYAFMRRADDISDDEGLPHSERRAILDAWLAEWHHAWKGGQTSNPVFFALRDASQRFNITPALLDQLVEGTAMDLSRPDTSIASPDNYAKFEDLYRYCYLVASVVGLVCIRIFGYTDPAAEKLAEETGIAFQLTNILRDVREDAERGRVYLPLEDLAASGLSLDDILHHPADAPLTAAHKHLFKLTADRAEYYYQSAQKLLPLINAESRPSLHVLVTIYHRLLKRIIAADYEVYRERISVPTYEKTCILLGGMLRILLARTLGAGKPRA
jgi:phytoene synthase